MGNNQTALGGGDAADIGATNKAGYAALKGRTCESPPLLCEPPKGFAFCPVCEGRGEVEAGNTTGRSYGWVDEHGVSEAEATSIQVNRAAWDRKHKTVWYLDFNQVVPGWSTAICMSCHGFGFVEIQQLEDGVCGHWRLQNGKIT